MEVMMNENIIYTLQFAVPVQGKLKIVRHKTFLAILYFQQFKEGPFLFKYDKAPVHKAAFIWDWFDDMELKNWIGLPID